MTTEFISPHQLSFSLAERAFLDAENLVEQNLAGEYLGLCSVAEEHICNYLHTHPTDIAAGCRFFAARTAWSHNASMQADHDTRIRMTGDLTDIMQHIDFCQPHCTKTALIIRECQNLNGQLC